MDLLLCFFLTKCIIQWLTPAGSGEVGKGGIYMVGGWMVGGLMEKVYKNIIKTLFFKSLELVW